MGIEPSRESPDNPLDSLSGRERDVLALLAQGLGSKEVAVRLSVSQHTVRVHTKSIHRKLSVTNRVQAILVFHTYS